MDQRRETPEGRSHQQAAHRPGERDDELVPGRLRLGPDAAHTSKQEQRDPVDLKSSSPGDNGVGKLVDQHRREQQQGGGRADSPVRRHGPARISVRQVSLGDRPGHHSHDSKPGVVNSDAHTENPSQANRGFQNGLSSWSSGRLPIFAIAPASSCEKGGRDI